MNHTLRVEGASDHGRVVYFQVVGPWTTRSWTVDRVSGESTWGPFANLPVPPGIGVLFWLFLGLALIMARQNHRAGKCDIRGAWRVTLAVLLLTLATHLLADSHMPHMGTELRILYMSLSLALFLAFHMWFFYAAVEPYVRRLWPDSLVSWNRLIAGRFRDSRVGRDVLYGVALAVVFDHVVAALTVFDVYSMGYLVPTETFLGTRYAIALFPSAMLWAVTARLRRAYGRAPVGSDSETLDRSE